MFIKDIKCWDPTSSPSLLPLHLGVNFYVEIVAWDQETADLNDSIVTKNCDSEKSCFLRHAGFLTSAKEDRINKLMVWDCRRLNEMRW